MLIDEEALLAVEHVINGIVARGLLLPTDIAVLTIRQLVKDRRDVLFANHTKGS